jgi:hypothetical protein
MASTTRAGFKSAYARAMVDIARRTEPALEAHQRFILWLVPTVEKFPRSRKFLLGCARFMRSAYASREQPRFDRGGIH